MVTCILTSFVLTELFLVRFLLFFCILWLFGSVCLLPCCFLPLWRIKIYIISCKHCHCLHHDCGTETVLVSLISPLLSLSAAKSYSLCCWWFLRATAYAVSAHMLSQFRLSIRLSVTRVDQSKTVEVRIIQFSPYSSPITLVFVR